MLPRYDENHRLTGVLKAVAITLVNDETIAGKQVAIGFFNPDGSQRGHIDLAKAVFNQVKGLLEANEPVTLESDRFNAKGTGLYYAFQQGEGFLAGPATTWIQPPPTETTMNSSPSPLRAASMLGIALISQAAAVTPAPSISKEIRGNLKADAVPAAPEHAEAARIARMDLKADLEASAAATAKAKAFLEQAELVSINTSAITPPPAKPLEVEPGPQDTVITCDGGMYFDADAGVFVYLKNVRVTDPRFTLSGANELKVFLEKKPEPAKANDGKNPPAAKPKDNPGLGINANFGDVERIVATGAVRILQKQVGARQGARRSQRRDFHLSSGIRRDPPQRRLSVGETRRQFHARQGTEPHTPHPEIRKLRHRGKLGNGRNPQSGLTANRLPSHPSRLPRHARSRLHRLPHRNRRPLMPRTFARPMAAGPSSMASP